MSRELEDGETMLALDPLFSAIFIIMIGTGTVLILFNLPLMFIIALVAAIGFLLPVFLNPATASEIRASLMDVGKISFISNDQIPNPAKNGR
jgi:hypothetical protein